MDKKKRERYVSKKRDVAAIKEELRFQPETKRSSRGQRSILGHRTRRGPPLVERSNYSCMSPFLVITRESQDSSRLP